MASKMDNKFTWVIKNFSTLESEKICSDPFIRGGCKWRLVVHPKGFTRADSLTLYLQVVDHKSLPLGWRRHARYQLTIVGQNSESRRKSSTKWFHQAIPGWGVPKMFPLNELHAEGGRFLVNNELKIVAEVEVLEVIGKLDVPEETQQPPERIKLEDRGLESEHLHEESSSSVDIKGVQILPSQVECLGRLFKNRPDLASAFVRKKQYPGLTCMFSLLGLIETLCESVGELSKDDLVEADNSLTYLKHSGFNMDWMEKKLVEVKGKKEAQQIGEARIQELEKELKDFEQRCSDVEAEPKDLMQKRSDTEALLEKEKANVKAARAFALTLDDIVW